MFLMNHGIVPFVPVTAVLLLAPQDKCSFSSLNRPGYRISQSSEGCDGDKAWCKLFEMAVAGTVPPRTGSCLSVYLRELNCCSQPERGWKKKENHSTPHMQMKVCVCANYKYSFCEVTRLMLRLWPMGK